MTIKQMAGPTPNYVYTATGAIDWKETINALPPEKPKSKWEASKIAVGLEVIREKVKERK
jgi:hypothetical protein